MGLLVSTLGWLALGAAICGIAYTIIACTIASPRCAAPATRQWPAITILKPLSGETLLFEHALATFLKQDYHAPVQVVFGIKSQDDAAAAVIAQLKARFPESDIAVVIDARVHGENRKVSNLINMFPAAKHDLIVLADGDIEVPLNYLQVLTAALSAPNVGAVSPFYSAYGLTNVWSRLSAMGIDYRFLPNAFVGVATGLAQPCFGATIALRRETLRAIGGFESLNDFLADDFELGRKVRGLGRSIAYPALMVRHACAESSFRALVQHELRSARTIRTIDPAGYLGTFVTFPVTFALIALMLQTGSLTSVGALIAAIAVQFVLKIRIDKVTHGGAGPFWLLPLRDIMSFGIFISSFFGKRVEWRGHQLQVAKDGTMRQAKE
jgi:ceramide glucosyltransferase